MMTNNYNRVRLAINYKRLLLVCFALCNCFFGHAQFTDNTLTTPGRFTVGANYWASHAGTHMWQDWKPEVIERDFSQLSAAGIKVLRVFPLWPDFQPIYKIYGGGGEVKYIAFKDGQPLPTTGIAASGMSEEQLPHFETLANLAQKYNIKLIVGLITGWMSGQLYVPQALEGKKLISDAESLSWQYKFVTTFVHRFKTHPAIIAWDFGNECNVMEVPPSYNEAFVWSALIASAIRSEDKTRPVVSGMHGESVSDKASWRIKDQAATTDLLTTHPYSLWTPFASQDAINSMRTVLHGAAETRLYGDIGGKPCLTEETGVMGPMTGGEKEKEAFARTALFSNWANDCLGTFWWCAYDQGSFQYPPYNYSSVENELGLIRENRSPKGVLNELTTFSRFIDKLPIKALPQRKTEAVCILTEGQDNWSVAYSSFILAKQAGFDFTFQKAGMPLKDAPFYLLPSLKGIEPVYKGYWNDLLQKVRAGATLYLSLDDAYLPSFNEPLGIEVLTNTKRRGALQFKSNWDGEALNFSTHAERKLTINPMGAKVLAREEDGNPVMLETALGKGKIYLLTFPLEANLTTTTGAFDKGSPQYNSVYKMMAAPFINQRIIIQPSHFIATTEHSLSANEKLVVFINYGAENLTVPLRIQNGWRVSGTWYGSMPAGENLTIKANDAVVLELQK